MKESNDCIFCRIVKKEVSAHIVYETLNTISILDIRPISPGHTLVIVKPHYSVLDELPAEYFNELMESIKKVGKAIKDGLNISAYNIVLNNGSQAGQLIPHIHFHIIPRRPGDGLSFHPKGQPLPESEFPIIKDRIRKFVI